MAETMEKGLNVEWLREASMKMVVKGVPSMKMVVKGVPALCTGHSLGIHNLDPLTRAGKVETAKCETANWDQR